MDNGLCDDSGGRLKRDAGRHVIERIRDKEEDCVLVGYMRVSKADGSQTVELQRDALLAGGVDAAHLYDDHASGRSDDRPGLSSCLKALRDGDTLVVWKLDRLGR